MQAQTVALENSIVETTEPSDKAVPRAELNAAKAKGVALLESINQGC